MTYHRLPVALAAACLLAACGAEPTAPAPTSAPAATSAGASAEPTSQPAPTVSSSTDAPTGAPAATAPSANDAPTSAPPARATFTPAAPTAPAGPAADQPVGLKLITNDLKQPVFATHAGDDSGRLFVVEKAGTIAIVRDGQRAPQPFLDITSLVTSRGSEQGLLGLAFHPDYRNNGRFFVYYTAQNGDNTLARYQVSSDANVADPNSGVVLFAVPDPAANHNGGMLAFGPDKYLYVGLGDGGSAGDPWGNGQNRNALLGKLLRLDVDKGDPYGIPADNPWPSASDARPEVWAYGLRNPWRFSFDRATGDLYIGDVGQNQYEEIDFQPAGTAGGRNYGWNTREGLHCYQAQDCATADLVDPVAEYSHEQGCSITGGYVYRGAAVPQLQGRYVYGDYCSGLIWTLRQAAPGQWEQRDLLKSSRSISSFAEDQAGELYLTDIGDNGLYQFVAGT
jgi:glucose/arabinose dehydrogenase